MTPYISRAISATRFPIILGPVMIHCQTGFDSTPYRLFWGEMVGRITVPLFFIISGYLFFQKFDGSIDAYKCKLKKRVSSLVIPYLLWNLLAFLFYWGIGVAEGDDFLLSFWVVDYHSGHSPADGPLWFLRTLILLLPLTPVVYGLNKNRYFCWISLVLYLLLFTNTGVFRQGTIFGFACFNLGGFFALSKPGKKLEEKFTPPPTHTSSRRLLLVNLVILTAFMTLCLVDDKLRISKGMVWGLVHWSMLTVGSVFAMTIPASLGEKTGQILDSLGKTSFFLFCLHEPLIPYIRMTVVPLAGSGDLGYTVTVIVVVTLCLMAYMLMMRLCPLALALLNGGR